MQRCTLFWRSAGICKVKSLFKRLFRSLNKCSLYDCIKWDFKKVRVIKCLEGNFSFLKQLYSGTPKAPKGWTNLWIYWGISIVCSSHLCHCQLWSRWPLWASLSNPLSGLLWPDSWWTCLTPETLEVFNRVYYFWSLSSN